MEENKDAFISELLEIRTKLSKSRKKYLEYQRQYRIRNREKYLEYLKGYDKQYHKAHRQQDLEYQRQRRLIYPEKFRESDVKHYNKRRGMGFKPLNKSFEGSVAHHLDETYVVYIPEELHRSVWHCLETDEGMEKINSLAMNFISEEGG